MARRAFSAGMKRNSHETRFFPNKRILVPPSERIGTAEGLEQFATNILRRLPEAPRTEANLLHNNPKIKPVFASAVEKFITNGNGNASSAIMKAITTIDPKSLTGSVNSVIKVAGGKKEAIAMIDQMRERGKLLAQASVACRKKIGPIMREGDWPANQLPIRERALFLAAAGSNIIMGYTLRLELLRASLNGEKSYA